MIILVIFEERLAAFYESAISQSQKPHMKIFHKIENMGDISIEKYDILLGNSYSCAYSRILTIAAEILHVCWDLALCSDHATICLSVILT